MTKSFYIGLSLMSSREAFYTTDRRKMSSTAGRRIVSLLDGSENGFSMGNDFAYEPGGRPYFADLHADFNISHSRDMVAAAFLPSSGGTPCRVGCDIQYVNPGKSCVEISRRFFHASEQAYIESAGPEQVRNFYRIWVLKEAWLKLHGLSVFEMEKAPAFSIGVVPDINVAGSSAADTVFFLYELSDLYMLAVARQSCGGEELEPEICWFSDTTLPLNRVENIYAAQSPEKTVTPKI